MKVAILGPNLRDQSKGQFHVHAAGCADLHKSVYRGVPRSDEDFSSIEEIAKEMFIDFLDENGEGWEEMAREDLYVLPCCELPYRSKPEKFAEANQEEC